MALVLSQQVETSIPIEVPGLTPDGLLGKSKAEIEKFPIWHGRQQIELAELFSVSGKLENDGVVIFDGHLQSVHGIGAKMKSGSIHLETDAGRRLGLQMAGGEIFAKGSVSDYAGVEMTGGTIRILRDAGNSIGGHQPGSKFGMNRGSIFVGGNVGKGLGQAMRRGTIVVGGNAGDAIGWNMLAGTIVVLGNSGANTGAEMKRGTIVLAGDHESLLPTFTQGLTQPVPMLRMLSKWMERQGFEADLSVLSSDFQVHHGDHLHGGRGEVFVR
jgi:formylmethanofuran dehydrogenase subunit C